MCGIVGAVAQRDAAAILLEGLNRLEYRGYDSAGMALLGGGIPGFQRHRVTGRVSALAQLHHRHPLKGHVGIAHTRWATHGVPSEANAHPHVCQKLVAVVHNGIIENYTELRAQQQGHHFTSETDTEVIAHLIYDFHQGGASLLTAVQQAAACLQGSYALGVISAREPQTLIAARHGSPLVVGLGFQEYFIASDVLALLPVTQRFIFLEEGDIAELTPAGVRIFAADGQSVERAVQTSALVAEQAERGSYRHYMLKEIWTQPQAVTYTLEDRISGQQVLPQIFGPQAGDVLTQVRAIRIVACGTSYHAGLVARDWLEHYTGLPCQTEIASEFCYRRQVVLPNTLFITLSQSGETADTLTALRLAKKLGYLATLAICNVPESSLVRESQFTLLTRAGPEVSVASTKAFTTQLVALLLLTLSLAKQQGTLSAAQEQHDVQLLRQLAGDMEQVLKLEPAIERWAQALVDKPNALFLGRGSQYPIALEGALKLKEISYIHAEGYPAGELKHGPLALIDSDMPVIAVAPNNELLEKLKSNLSEVRARGGRLYVVADARVALNPEPGYEVIHLPPVDELLAPLLFTIPLQLLAYHVAVLKGTDVDHPRNLAKSVTVT